MATTTLLQHRTGISTGTAITMNILRSALPIVPPPKPDVEIHVDNYRKIYSTADTIRAKAIIKARVDTEFSEVEITFLGHSKTLVDSVTTTPALSGRTDSNFSLLRMMMTPSDLRRYYPEDMVLRAGQTYEVPFSFVVPEHMPLGTCRGNVKHESVLAAHILLPPTLCDKEFQVADGMQDDQGCQMASIRYGIYVKVMKSNSTPEHPEKTTSTCLSSAMRKVRIIPGTDEAPPLDVSGTPDRPSLNKRDYELRSERRIKKAMLGPHLGTITIESEQPKEFRTLPPDSGSKDRVNTKATVMLRYDPIKGSTAPPPRLEKLVAKLKCRTYYTTVTRTDFPKPGEDPNEAYKAMNSESLELSSRALNRVEWIRQDSTSAGDQLPLSARRASASSDCSERNSDNLNTWQPTPPESYKEGEPFFLARLSVPIALPKNKLFLPTFHSCFISRIYTLGMNLHIAQAGFGSMDLRVPVQICASRNSAQEPAAAARRRSEAVLATVIPSLDFDAFADFDDISNALFGEAGSAFDGSPSAAREPPPLYEDHTLDRSLATPEASASRTVNPVR